MANPEPAVVEVAETVQTPVIRVNTNDKLKEDLQQWAKNKEGKPLVLVAVGRGGVGKSTLVNNLLGLKKGDKHYCPPGNLARAKTTKIQVCKVPIHGVEVHIVDTPGLGASLDAIHSKTVIEELSEKAGHADLLFYCASFHPGARLDGTDVKLVDLFTKAYGLEVWKRAFLLLTFANHSSPEDYVERVEDYARAFGDILKKAGVGIQVEAKLPSSPDTVVSPAPTCTTAKPAGSSIPAIPIGDSTLELNVPFKYNWSDILFIEALKKASDAQTLAKLLALRGFKVEVGEVVGGAIGGGAIVGGAVGGAAGAAAGLGLGLFIGAPVGAVVGGTGGVILAIAKTKIEKFQATNF
jgi:energy-coupling factor transporter ATP-binding protein EcfA2